MANRQISENYEMKTDEEYKQIGNDLFKQNKLNEALEQYLEAIKINPENGCVYSNIALVYIRLEKYGQAVIEATKSVKFGYNKGYYRRASAYLAMANFDKAAKDFRIASKLFPSNFGIKNKLAFCNAEIRKAIFTDSIKNENNIPLSERLDLDKFVVPDDFSGLKLNFPLNRETVLEIKSNLKQQKRIHIRFVYQIILKTIEILKSEQNLVKSSIPKEAKFNVCGDVHGQFYDLVNIFEIFGEPSKNNIFLFNGDVVDRGAFSVECILLLFCYKILLPKSFYINRGNHESDSMNKLYGFRNEVVSKYDETLYFLFLEAFSWLPLGHVLGEKVFICHGGLFSDKSVTIEMIDKINRVKEIPESGIMSEILWSDPHPENGLHPSKRGAGIAFGPDIAENFLNLNNLNLVIRSHEMMQNGYETMFDGKLITVFSAPNYCDNMNNKGAVIVFKDDYSYDPLTFGHVDHPKVSANYGMNFG